MTCGGSDWIDAVKPKKGAADVTVTSTAGYRGVPEEVWNFHVGGYQVREKWLKDRKDCTLTAEDIAHYYRIVIAMHAAVMPEDFAGAAVRHFRDGALLERNRRISNADQLFGFAAECAIKSALVGLPGCADAGTLAEKYHTHIEKLWDLAQLQSIQKRFPQLVDVLRTLKGPFADWSTHRRYEPDAAVTEDALGRHRQAAARVLGSVGLSGARGEG